VYVQQTGPDQDRFFDFPAEFCAEKVLPELR